MWKYSIPYKLLLIIKYTVHDLNKIFSPHILRYVKQYDLHSNNIDGYDDLLCWHDKWAIEPIVTQPMEYPVLNKFLNSKRNQSFSSDYEILDFCDELFDLCRLFGEDCVSFYLRNYNHFNIASADERYYVENDLCISFDKYIYEYTEGLCIHEIFDKDNYYYDEHFAKYVAKSLLFNFGVNIYDVLNIDEPNGELEEFEEFCEEE